MDNPIKSFLKTKGKESNVENNNADWCQLFFINYSSTKINHIHTKSGKVQTIDDTKWGKYSGKIADASDKYHDL
ncbi:MAG TPA: hypothetical protein VFI73_04375 [Candidatus Nitrosopolaris sp.]|nr:hypothetical protein [Candidatus Nitrosopolaris sp.]